MKTMPPSPRSAKEVLDVYFLETRAKLLEIAANMDRMERAEGLEKLQGDARLKFVADALEILRGPPGNRAERVQVLYSMK
jgi:hypothetical protein